MNELFLFFLNYIINIILIKNSIMKIIKLQKKISVSQIGNRLDTAITNTFINYSRSCIKRWILKGYVKVNNKIINIPKKKF